MATPYYLYSLTFHSADAEAVTQFSTGRAELLTQISNRYRQAQGYYTPYSFNQHNRYVPRWSHYTLRTYQFFKPIDLTGYEHAEHYIEEQDGEDIDSAHFYPAGVVAEVNRQVQKARYEETVDRVWRSMVHYE